MRLTSKGIIEGTRIPVEYTAEGENDSPELTWSAVDGAASYALINDDPDAPGGTWVHWLVYNIPKSVTSLERGFPADGELADGTLQGTTSKKDIGYSGPLPPPGLVHRYFFKIYALDAILDLPAGATKEKLVDAMADHILDEAQLMGTYSR